MKLAQNSSWWSPGLEHSDEPERISSSLSGWSYIVLDRRMFLLKRIHRGYAVDEDD
jgi:hypothetical protein